MKQTPEERLKAKKEHQKRYYQRNHERILNYQREYRLKNGDKKRAYARARYQQAITENEAEYKQRKRAEYCRRKEAKETLLANALKLLPVERKIASLKARAK